MLDSAALGAARVVSVYRPPGHQGPLPGCVLADGGAARGLAHTLEPVILAGAVPPVLLAGVHNAFDPANPWRDRRAQEYLPGHLSPPLRRASALRHRRGPPLGHRPVGPRLHDHLRARAERQRGPVDRRPRLRPTDRADGARRHRAGPAQQPPDAQGVSRRADLQCDRAVVVAEPSSGRDGFSIRRPSYRRTY